MAESGPGWETRQRALFVATATAAAYYAGAQIGVHLRFPPATTSVIWPPNSILTAVLLMNRPRHWWVPLAAAFPVHVLVELQAGFPLPMILMLFVTNCAEALIAAGLVHYFSDAPDRFDTLRRVTVFVAGAAFVAPVLSSFLDAAAVTSLRGEPYDLVLRRRLLSNCLSELTLVPAIVIALRRGRAWLRAAHRPQRLEAGLLAVTLAVVAATVFTGLGDLAQLLPGAPYTSLPFLMPLLIWAAVRFGPGGASISLLATALDAIAAALSGRRPFTMLGAEESVVALQVFVIVVGVPLLLFSGLLEEHREAARALRERLRFEELLSRVTAAFVRPPSHRMDEAFEASLRDLGEGLEVDRVVLRALSRDGEVLHLVSAWARNAGGPPPPALPAADHAWWADRVLAGEVVAVGRTEDLPPDPAVRDVYNLQGVRASVTVPLAAGGRVLGCLSLGSAAERTWSDLFRERWRLIGDVLAGALVRKQTEDALRAGEAMKGDILASLTNQVAVVDRNGRIVSVNESWSRLLGDDAPAGEAVASVGANLLEVWSALASRASQETESVATGIAAVLDGSRPAFVHEYRHTGGGGERTFLMTVVPLRAAVEGGAVVALTDVTDRREAEAQAQTARQDLAHYLRVSTIGELTTSLAHQLNQPLAAILANAQAARRFLEAGPVDTAEIKSILADIVDEDKRAGEVIAGLRALLRKSAAERVLLDVNSLVGEVSRLLGSEVLIRKARLVFEPHPGPLTVIGDRVQIQQVVLNLLMNAIDAAAEREQSERVVVVRTGHGEPANARISVEDSGPGLAGDTKDRIFDPFFTTKASGMGMGLPIARSIVEAHGGTILAANNPERGATFAVVLPLARPAAPAN
jgi:PAS domain S-box-containing protein